MSGKATTGGFSGAYPALAELSVLAGPATGAEKNTVRMPLIPVACWRINDLRFEFDSSFIGPDSADEFAELAALRKQHAGAPLSVFGHADPVGDDDYNKNLSGRRAEAVYAVLIRDAARWEKLYSVSAGGDSWGLRSIQVMLKKLGHDPGPITGTNTPQTKSAVEAFQKKNGQLQVDGVAGPKTREKLFVAYMDAICPLKLAKTDFLSKGEDANGKGDFQGCSEFNPVLVFSQTENAHLNKPENKTLRNEENSPNRRVMVLLFRPGSYVPPAKWPCPRASEGVSGCKARFWSDGETRRQNRSTRREFAKTRDTFACRFYHRLVISSPCEGTGPVTPAVLLLDLLKVDDHFCPKQEMLDIEYELKGFAGKVVKIQITSAHAPKNPIYERELTTPEKTDGRHKIQWDGKSNSNEAELKDLYIHPLWSPYKVTLVHDSKYTDSLETKVLYHSIRLRNGPWTPDEKEPPESEEKKWVAYKLNELGYWGGPVGKDFDNYLKKAIIRYKANHVKFRKTFIGDYDDTITAELKTALKNNENDRKFPKLEATEDSSKQSKLFVEELTYERLTATTDEFGTTRASHEKNRLNRPLFPVEAEIYLRKKDDSKALEPEAVGACRINWRHKDPHEDLSGQFDDTNPAEPSKTKKFIEKTLKLKSGRTGTNGDNCHKDFGGVRDDPAKNWNTPFQVGDHYEPYRAENDNANKVVFSKACTDRAKYPKRLGRAGIFMRPSFIAGDDYQFTAEIDFTGLPNKAELEKFHGITADEKTKIKAETGTYTVWRFGKVAMSIDWPARTNDYEWNKVALEFRKAFLEIDVSNIVTRKFRDVIPEPDYKTLVTTHTSHTDPAKITLFDDALVGVALPAQGNRNAAQYKAFLQTFTHTNFNSRLQSPIGNKLSQVVRKTHATGFVILNFLLHKPVNIQNDPANGDTTVTAANTNFITWGGSIGLPDSVILLDQKDPDKVYYVVAHEMGHNLYLLHWENTGENNAAHHDQNDRNCMMSYSTDSVPHQKPGVYTPHFCGKCNLALRGWDILAGGMAEKSKAPAPEKSSPKVKPSITLEKNVVVAKKAHTTPVRRKVTLSVDKPFNGSGTLTCPSNAVTFHTAKTAGATVDLTAGKTYSGAQLKSGQNLWVEGAAGADNITLTLTLQPGSDGKEVEAPATATLTSVEVNLQLTDMAGNVLNDAEKASGNCEVFTREFDNQNTRARLDVQVIGPVGYSGRLELKANNTKVKLFDTPIPASNDAARQRKLPYAFAAAARTWYIEGVQDGASGFQLTVKDAGDVADTVAVRVITVTYPELEVQQVDFSGPAQVTVDRDTTGADDNRWTKGRAAQTQSLLCYPRNSQIQLGASFNVTRPPSHNRNVRIRGKASLAGTAITWESVAPHIPVPTAAASVALPAVNGSVPIPNKVRCYDPMKITWEMSQPNGKWVKIGETENVLYAVLGAPVGGVTPYWTLLDLSCRAAKDVATQADLIKKAFKLFQDHTGSGKGMKRKHDGQEMAYYRSGIDTASAGVFTTADLLSKADGSCRCGAWGRFFRDMLKCHGVTGAVIGVAPLNAPILLVKNLQFNGPGTRGDAVYTHVGQIECVKQDGVKGQGSDNPQFLFGDHALVRAADGKIYDPSYGTGPFADLKAWEEAGIDALGDSGPGLSVFMFKGVRQAITDACSKGFLIQTVSAVNTFATIAANHGMTADALLNHPYNAALKGMRGTVAGVLVGDRVFVPRNPKRFTVFHEVSSEP